MEKYARQALSEGVKSDQDLHIHEDSELYRVLNVHYNRNNHIEVRKQIFGQPFYGNPLNYVMKSEGGGRING